MWGKLLLAYTLLLVHGIIVSFIPRVLEVIVAFKHHSAENIESIHIFADAITFRGATEGDMSYCLVSGTPPVIRYKRRTRGECTDEHRMYMLKTMESLHRRVPVDFGDGMLFR